MTDRYHALQEFFLSYFHPDWKLDASSPTAVAQQFLGTADPATVRDLVDELRQLLHEQLTEQQLHDRVLADYSLFYDPWSDELSMREWLEGLLQDISNGEQAQ